MSFKEEIMKLEQEELNTSYIYRIGTTSVILTAPHTMEQEHKLSEPFTKAIAAYVANKVDCSYLIKLQDTGIDSNKDTEDDFKVFLKDIIKNNEITLLIDIHGASQERPFSVELGTLNNLSADYSTIKELTDSFNENGISNIEFNEPFKGGGITRFIYGTTNIDVIQIEINREYRNIEESEKIEQICNSLINFIKQYTNYR